MPHDLSPAALAAAQAAGEATYMAATDDREALPQAIEAAIGAYLEGLWRPISEATGPKVIGYQKSAGDWEGWIGEAKPLQHVPGFYMGDNGQTATHFQPLPLPSKDAP
jgi:hypothetical protein